MDPQRPTRPTATRPPQRRRRRRKRTYIIRRAVVLVVLAAMVLGVVRGASALFGGDESSASSPSTGVGDTTTTAAVIVDPSTGVSNGTAPDATATSSTAAVVRVPSATDPARVLLLGDSEAGGLSPFLDAVLDDTGMVDMATDYKVSSGLVRPDFFDWPAHLQSTVPTANPDIVVALFGGNDGQPFLNTTNPVDSAEWRAEYGKRVAAVMEFLSSGGRTLIWVGVPNAEDEKLTGNLQIQNEVVKQQAAAHPDVVFVDAWYRFAGIDGGFAPQIEDPRDGQFKEVRSNSDGFHLNTIGEEILAFDVGNAVIAEMKARGAAL
jgi:uncharacterized protein